MSERDSEHDSLFATLGELPSHDCGAERRERLRELAHAALAPRRRRGQRWARAATRAYCQVLEPALVSVLSVVFLSWAVARVVELLG